MTPKLLSPALVPVGGGEDVGPAGLVGEAIPRASSSSDRQMPLPGLAPSLLLRELLFPVLWGTGGAGSWLTGGAGLGGEGCREARGN